MPRKLKNKRPSKTIGAVKKLRKSLIASDTTEKRPPKTQKRHLTSAKTSHGRKANGFHGGTYITPKGNVSIGIPAFWSLRQTNDDLEVESPSRKTSVIVTAFQRENGVAKLDARAYLEHFLQSASMKGRAQAGERSVACPIALPRPRRRSLADRSAYQWRHTAIGHPEQQPAAALARAASRG